MILIDDLKDQLQREKKNREKSANVFLKNYKGEELVDSEEIKKGITNVGEQVLEYKKEMKAVSAESEKSKILRDKVKSMDAQILSLKNDIFTLRRVNEELRKNNEELKKTIERVVYKIKHPFSAIKDIIIKK